VRVELTKRLIAERGFTIVAVEADWPDANRVNRYVRGVPHDGLDRSALDALADFTRFPAWMWRNTVVRDFVEWLRDRNANIRPTRDKAGFYGVDLYSMYGSMEAVLGYLEKVDPAAAKQARARYGCFEHYQGDPQEYGLAAAKGITDDCQREAVQQLLDLQRKRGAYTARDGQIIEDEQFFAEQNARLVVTAETYYRTMFEGRVNSWNLRDTHMADTLDALIAHVSRQTGAPAKAVVWAHNSHLGDARATEAGDRGELNLGQLVRQRHPGTSFHLGFTTYSGSVTAARDWGGPGEHRFVRPALHGSYEALFHEVSGEPGHPEGVGDFVLPVRASEPLQKALRTPARLERAIGVIYAPRSERYSHYFYCHLAEQFDAVIHIDQTRALEPLDPSRAWHTPEVPETYPSAL
jgi:erythromycin esterase-like protein